MVNTFLQDYEKIDTEWMVALNILMGRTQGIPKADVFNFLEILPTNFRYLKDEKM